MGKIDDIRAYIEHANLNNHDPRGLFSCRVDDIAAMAHMPDRCEAVILAFEFGRAKGVRMERKRAAARKAGEV